MAVKGPDVGIIRFELQRDVPARTQHLGVTTLRVRGVDDRCTIPGAVAFVKDLEVMAVEVEGLGGVIGQLVLSLVVIGRSGKTKPYIRERCLLMQIARFAR